MKRHCNASRGLNDLAIFVSGCDLGVLLVDLRGEADTVLNLHGAGGSNGHALDCQLQPLPGARYVLDSRKWCQGSAEPVGGNAELSWRINLFYHL